MNLRDYERVKFELAEILRMVPYEAGRAGQLRELFGRLAEDRFNLVVVGRFSRGKTSLMNALLGMDRLPTGVVPLTSVITTVGYGSEERVTLHYPGTSLFTDIRLDQLPDYITERGNPGNQRGVSIAEVQLPAAILRRGFHFVDTPGLGSSIAENTRTTEAFLPEADAFVLVTSFDSPLSAEEGAVLRAARGKGRRVFLVVNKQDAVSQDDRNVVLDHIAAQLEAIFGDDLPSVFPVSARQGLQARLVGDAAGVSASGLRALEQALIAFLVSGKRREFLLAMCSRMSAELAGSGAAAATARLDVLRRAIAVAEPGSTSELRESVTAEPANVETTIDPNLPQCEVCVQVEEAVFNFLAHYQNRLSHDQTAQSDLAARHGLCGPHTWQFEAIAAPREVCSGFASVVECQAASLRAIAEGGNQAARICEAVERILPDARRCPVCQAAATVEAQATARVASRIRNTREPGPDAVSALCLPHLGPILALLGDTPALGALLRRQASLLERLAEDMRRFALKQDAARRGSVSREELGASKRGTLALVGAPNAYPAQSA
jgi:small GTP-binding protein